MLKSEGNLFHFRLVFYNSSVLQMEPLWRFVVSVLALLPLTTGDFTSFHLYNFLNHSVSACADFHGHVCGTIMFPYGTVQKRSERFYKLWAEKLNSRSENDAIMVRMLSEYFG